MNYNQAYIGKTLEFYATGKFETQYFLNGIIML